MKIKRLLSILLVPLFIVTMGADLNAQDTVAVDDASNYTSDQFQNLENRGSGFGDWNRVIEGEDAAVLLQTAQDNGENSAVIDTDGQSFALRASETDSTNQNVYLGREFSGVLEDGQTLSFDLAWNWATPGLTGFELNNGSWEDEDQVMRLDFDASGYFVNGDSVEAHASEEDWGTDENPGWREEGVALEVSFTRNGDNLGYTVVAITDSSDVDFSGTLEGVNADRINFFNEGRPNWGDTGQGSMFVNNLAIISGSETSIEQSETVESFALKQNYPNPFNPSTNITFTLDEASEIKLSVFDLLGREIEVLQEGVKSAGQYTVQFNAEGLNSGVYMYRLSTESGTQTRRMMLIK